MNLSLILTRYFLVVSKVAPWIQRASDIKAEVVVNHELEHKLQQHNEEIIKLIKDVRLKVPQYEAVLSCTYIY